MTRWFMNRAGKWLYVVALSSILTAPVVAQPQQSVHRTGFVPASPSVYAVIKHFYDYDRELPLNARTVEAWDAGDLRFETIVFTAHSGERVPGDLALPNGDGPFPCVLLIHGLGNDRDRWWKEDREALPNGLLRAGIAVLTIDLRLHGARNAQNDYRSPVHLTMEDDLPVRNRDMIIDSTIDCRRALDCLRGRADIDGDRLGVAGYSMGGMIAITLSALEKDLRAVVACAVPTGDHLLPIDPFHFAPHSRSPVLLQIGRTDWLSSPPDAELLQSLFPGEAELVFYDAGHRLPPMFAEDAARWLRDGIARP